MIRSKYIKVDKDNLEKNLFSCKVLSKSLQEYIVILKEFNGLTGSQRRKIKNDYDESFKVLIQKELENSEELEILIMVNANIIATKYDVDPATVILCISDVCKSTEKIIGIC